MGDAADSVDGGTGGELDDAAARQRRPGPSPTPTPTPTPTPKPTPTASPAPPPGPLDTDYTKLSPLSPSFVLEEKFASASHAQPAYWAAKPQLPATLEYPRIPTISAAERDAVRQLHAGWFRPSATYEWTVTGVPPPWTDSTTFDRTWTFNAHSLAWAAPLVKAWSADGDAASLALAKEVVTSWITANSTPPGASKEAWGAHAVSIRARFLLWFWTVWQPHAASDPEFARLVLKSLYQHATYLSQPEQYPPTGNQALHVDGTLYAAALTFPEFREAARWRALAEKRYAAYPVPAFSKLGFHLEQAPYYHWYALADIGRIAEFLRGNGVAPPAEVDGVLERGFRAWHYLLRPDRRISNIGDSLPKAFGVSWPTQAAQLLGRPLPPPMPSTLPAARPDSGEFVLDFESGYAFFTSYPAGKPAAGDDTWISARANARPIAGHAHPDALSFELYALGRDWIVDSGKLSYEEASPDRKYMRTSRAHSVVLVDDAAHGFGTVRLLASGRTAEADSFTSQHELPSALHTRTFDFLPPRGLRLTDVLEARDGKAHRYAQLFQVAPGLEVRIVSSREVQLVAPDGRRCTIRQLGAEGAWSAITGQEEPFFQGWYSEVHAVRVPITTLFYTTPGPALTWAFETELTVE